MPRARRRRSKTERLVEPRLDHLNAKSWQNDNSAAPEAQETDIPTSPPSPVATSFDQRKPLVIDAVIIDTDPVLAGIKLGDSS